MVPITLTSAEPSSTRTPYPQMPDMTDAIPRAFSLLQMAEAGRPGGHQAPGDGERSQPRSLFSLSPVPGDDQRPVEGRDERVREEGGNDGDDEEEEEREGDGGVDDDEDDDVEEEEAQEEEEDSSEGSDECDETSDDDDDDDDDEEDSCA